jgi:hypothetical protein
MAAVAERARLQRRGVWLEWFTVTWNVVEATVAITAGVVAGSIALVGFGIDSGIEVVAASALLWRFRAAGAGATAEEHGPAERRALYIVGTTSFVLAVYISYEAQETETGVWLPGHSQHHFKRRLRSWPVFLDKVAPSAAEHDTKDERDQDCVVKCASNRDEVGDQVYGHRQVRDQPDQQPFVTA